MDQVAKLPGKSISSVLQPTFEIFIPLLAAKQSLILSIPRKTYCYGAHPRQTLDIYFPSTESASGAPVLVFLYGGGLTLGDKILAAGTPSLIYHNLGTFFALRGFVTIIPDYRRVDDPQAGTGEGATFPSGGEDLAAVLEWLQSADCLVKTSGTERRDVFIMGNSAGGVHLSTYLFYSTFEEGRKQLMKGSGAYRLRGAVLLSVPLDFKGAISERADALDRYWRADLSGESCDRSRELFCANGLLQSLKGRKEADGVVKPADVGVPKVLMLLGELDPDDEINEPGMRFIDVWKDVFGGSQDMEFKWMRLQNHISPPLALMTGDHDGEEWGEDVVHWMKGIMGEQN